MKLIMEKHEGILNFHSVGFDGNMEPHDFVSHMRKKGSLIMGIGHRVKSINNPDMRVVILKKFVKENFPSTPLLDYALEVEKITTGEKHAYGHLFTLLRTLRKTVRSTHTLSQIHTLKHTHTKTN